MNQMKWQSYDVCFSLAGLGDVPALLNSPIPSSGCIITHCMTVDLSPSPTALTAGGKLYCRVLLFGESEEISGRQQTIQTHTWIYTPVLYRPLVTEQQYTLHCSQSTFQTAGFWMEMNSPCGYLSK